MATKKKKKVSKKNTKRKVSKKTFSNQSSNNKLFIYAGIAVLLIVVALAFSGGQKPSQDKKINVKEKQLEVKDNKVSDIKKTKKVEPLNIPKKTKAINNLNLTKRQFRLDLLKLITTVIKAYL